jgi:hypothetical protein
MYIPTFGLVPNSGYVPAQFVNADGYVTVDEFLNVKSKGDGVGAPLKDIWALGDVTDLEYAQFISCDKQSAHLAKNVILALRADSTRPPLPYKAATKRTCALSSLSFPFHSSGLFPLLPLEYMLLYLPQETKI